VQAIKVRDWPIVHVAFYFFGSGVFCGELKPLANAKFKTKQKISVSWWILSLPTRSMTKA
jgi:hypothetical protein